MSLTMARRLRRFRARGARWFGRAMHLETCHLALRDLLRSRAIDLVLDVGANGPFARRPDEPA